MSKMINAVLDVSEPTKEFFHGLSEEEVGFLSEIATKAFEQGWNASGKQNFMKGYFIGASVATAIIASVAIYKHHKKTKKREDS